MPERPVASIPQVHALADAVGGRFRVMILAAAFTRLRWGELVGLRRRAVKWSQRLGEVGLPVGSTFMIFVIPETTWRHRRGRRRGS